MLDVTAVLRPERTALLVLLDGLAEEDWGRPTECPAYTVQGIASHVLGDDLSLLSRQRDGGVNGLFLLAETMPGADFRTLLDAFNDRWVVAASFFSPAVLIELLRVAGEWTATFYEEVDLESSSGEPVMFFGDASPSPYWMAIAREYVERWVHHSQIRRALGLPSLADEAFLRPAIEVVAAAFGKPWRVDERGWWLGDSCLGDAVDATAVLTRAPGRPLPA